MEGVRCVWRGWRGTASLSCSPPPRPGSAGSSRWRARRRCSSVWSVLCWPALLRTSHLKLENSNYFLLLVMLLKCNISSVVWKYLSSNIIFSFSRTNPWQFVEQLSAIIIIAEISQWVPLASNLSQTQSLSLHSPTVSSLPWITFTKSRETGDWRSDQDLTGCLYLWLMTWYLIHCEHCEGQLGCKVEN